MYITFILILILLFELCKACEYLDSSDTPTPQFVKVNDAAAPVYLLLNKDILIGKQPKGATKREWVYNYIQGVPAKYILVKARIDFEDRVVEQTKIIQINKTYTSQDLFGTAGVLQNTNKYNVSYAIEFLSDQAYIDQMYKITKENKRLAEYNQCINLNSGSGIGSALVAERCRAGQK